MKSLVIIIGGGGHARVLADALIAKEIDIVGYVDKSNTGLSIRSRKIKYLGNDDCMEQYNKNNIVLVNGIGSVKTTDLRRQIYDKYKKSGFTFYTLLHHSAIVSVDVEIGDGVQIMAGAIIQAGTVIGENSIINTGSSIDHDCNIGRNVHISPGVTISGGVTIQDDVHVGTGANIIQGIKVGNGTTIGAGSLVLNDLPGGVVCYGVPAKIEGSNERL